MLICQKESGETMKAAGLKAIGTVMDTQAVLIKSKNPTNPALVDIILSRIRGVITAKKYVLCTYNLPRSKLSTVNAITPGKRAPTITTLEEEGWIAVSVMVEKKTIADVMDRYVLPISLVIILWCTNKAWIGWKLLELQIFS